MTAQGNLLFEQVKYADACEMRANARVKWRFSRSAVAGSLRDRLKFLDFVVFCPRTLPRDAIPSTLRLPRPRCGLAMTRNWDVFCLNQAPFCQIQSLSIESLRRFPAKPLGHVIARSEATRQSLTERNGIPERNLEKQRETVCVLQARHHLLLSVSCSRASPRDAIPSALRLPRPQCGLAMTQKW